MNASSIPEEESGLNIVSTPNDTDESSNVESNEIIKEEISASTEDNPPVAEISAETNLDDSKQTPSETETPVPASDTEESPIVEEQTIEEPIEQPVLSPMEQIMSELSDFQ